MFHESRVGSTMVSNLLTTLGRVYSEPYPIYTAMTSCSARWDGQLSSDCDAKKQRRLLQDVIYMMQRANTKEPSGSNAPKRVFFKFGSRLTPHISKLTELFPHTPWVFLYRDPIEVLVSHQKKSSCLSKTYLPEDIKEAIGRRGAGNQSVWAKHDIQFCAAQLAGICEAALQHLRPNGRLVNHQQLPIELWNEVLPNHFGIAATGNEQQRMEQLSGVYSKRRRDIDGGREWKGDEVRKHIDSTPETRSAASTFLQPTYTKLEEARKQQTAGWLQQLLNFGD